MLLLSKTFHFLIPDICKYVTLPLYRKKMKKNKIHYPNKQPIFMYDSVKDLEIERLL